MMTFRILSICLMNVIDMILLGGEITVKTEKEELTVGP